MKKRVKKARLEAKARVIAESIEQNIKEVKPIKKNVKSKRASKKKEA